MSKKEVKKQDVQKSNKKTNSKSNEEKVEFKEKTLKKSNKEEKKVDNNKDDNKEAKSKKEDMKKEYEEADVKKVENKKQKIKNPVNEKVIIFGIIIVVLLIAFGIFGYFFYETGMKPVATYDGGKVTKSEYTIYYKTFKPMLTYFGYPDSIIPEQIANKAALDEIIVKEAKEAGVTVSEDRKKEIDEQFADKTQLSQLEQQGINPDQMKQLYYVDALISAYIDKRVDEVNDEEVLNYIKQKDANADLNGYETCHILLKTTDSSGAKISDSDKANKKAQAETILKRAQAGEDFTALVTEFSEDTGTKDDGGKYNVYSDGKTDETYANAVKTMKVGDIVLVESQYGYHIIKLMNVVENGRAQNKNDREDFVNEQLNDISTQKHYAVNNDNLAKVVEEINGKTSSEANNATTDNTTDTTTQDNTNTTTNTTTGE